MTKTISQTVKAPIARTSRRRNKRLKALVMALLRCCPHPVHTALRPGRREARPSAVDLLAHDGQRPLIDRSSIPRLDGCEIGLAGLIAGARAPAMSAKEVCRRGERVGGNLEIAADTVLENVLR